MNDDDRNDPDFLIFHDVASETSHAVTCQLLGRS